MGARATATVVLVARDRWWPSLTTFGPLLAGIDGRHTVRIIDGGAPARVRALFDGAAAASDRVSVVRRRRFLGSNEARNLGTDGARTPWIAFVENDCRLSDGWLEALLEFAESRDAASAYPAYLQHEVGAMRVHGLGCDITIGGRPGARTVKEHTRHLGAVWSEVRGDLVPNARVQAEPHALVIRREVLEGIGGLDEGLVGWFEHVDLALHHDRLGASSWNVPDVECVYRPAPPLHPRDVESFLVRWGRDCYERSLARLCQSWGLDPDDGGWANHDRYRRTILAGVVPGGARFRSLIDGATRPLGRIATRRWDRSVASERR